MTRPAQALIDLQALQHNLRVAQAAAPRTRVMAVIKANAYGHGLLRAARALAAADAFGVAHLNEAVTLREGGIRQPAVLLEGFGDQSELHLLARHNLETVVHHPSQVEMLEAVRLATPLRVWVKVDTGMHRLGIAPERVVEVTRRLAACVSVAGPLRYLTHLACADDRNDVRTVRQLETFSATLGELPGERSVANSAGMLGWKASHADWARPGIMLYGVSPFLGGAGARDGLQPAMTLTTRLIAVNRYPRGEAIGYGGSWICPEDMSVGVAAVGYGDGYPRHARAGTPVLLNGVRVPLVGRVSMDMISLDLRTQPDARIGDPVVLWGRGLPVEDVAECAGTIGYELLCGVSQRVEMRELNGIAPKVVPLPD